MLKQESASGDSACGTKKLDGWFPRLIAHVASLCREWQTGHMSKALRNDYLLLVLTGITLVVGLVGRFLSLEVLSLTAFIAGAAIGLALSISLLVAAIRHGEFGSDVLALISIIATALTSEWLAASVIALML